ncbi:hypothetical protein [Streptomyces sp. NBC_00212]
MDDADADLLVVGLVSTRCLGAIAREVSATREPVAITDHGTPGC